MRQQWSVVKKRDVFMQLQKDGSLELRIGWRLKCPKGHTLHVFTNFEGLDVAIGVHCEKCDSEYLVKL